MTGVTVKGRILRADCSLYDGTTLSGSRADSAGGTYSGLKLGDSVDVLSVYGGGSSYARATLAAAIAACGSNYRMLDLAPGNWVIDSNLTIPSNIAIHMAAGAFFAVSNGVTLTISGPLFRRSTSYTSGLGTVSPAGHDNLGASSYTDSYAADTGTADTYAIAPAPSIAAYAAGQRFRFLAANTNTGASTLAVNGLAAKAIKKNLSTALIAGDISTGKVVEVVYDGTNFQMVSYPPLGTAAARDTGVSSGNIPLMGASGYPAAAGSLITNLAAVEGGGFELLESADWSAQASKEYTSKISSTHDHYMLFFSILPGTDGADLWLRVSTNNGAAYLSGGSDYSWIFHGGNTGGGGPSETLDASDSQIDIAQAVGNVAGENAVGVLTFTRNGTTMSHGFRVHYSVGYVSSASVLVSITGLGRYGAGINAIALLPSTGVFTGESRLYGIKNT